MEIDFWSVGVRVLHAAGQGVASRDGVVSVGMGDRGKLIGVADHENV